MCEKVTLYKWEMDQLIIFKTRETHVPQVRPCTSNVRPGWNPKGKLWSSGNRVHNGNVDRLLETLWYTKFNMSPCFTRFYWQGSKLKHLASPTSPNCFSPPPCVSICYSASFISILVLSQPHTFSTLHSRLLSKALKCVSGHFRAILFTFSEGLWSYKSSGWERLKLFA